MWLKNIPVFLSPDFCNIRETCRLYGKNETKSRKPFYKNIHLRTTYHSNNTDQILCKLPELIVSIPTKFINNYKKMMICLHLCLKRDWFVFNQPKQQMAGIKPGTAGGVDIQG
ncbi:hypothetical protein CDIK_3232 [Cucumispora dikerogammari]|nr:hypothetical protein CDIK_3232 [Cucumispora dikerogammari]